MSKMTLMAGGVVAAILASSAASAQAPEMMNVRWGKNAFNFEAMPSGPQPLRNLSRRADGTADAGKLVGDYNNPVLTPEAAAVVRQKGALAIAGKGFPNSQDQCRAVAPPFALAMGLALQMLPAKDGNLTIIYDQNANVRHVRMNGMHPANLKPSPKGDSVGHWEGDALVIDTVGVKVDPFTSVDRFGTPQSDAMHVVERYRLIDGAVAKAQVDQFEFNEGTVGGGGRNGGGRNAGYNPDTRLKGLQLEITMEDPKVFKQALTARVTYRRLLTELEENVCADNPVEHYAGEWQGLPKAEKPDF
jgi:hypothetical protein